MLGHVIAVMRTSINTVDVLGMRVRDAQYKVEDFFGDSRMQVRGRSGMAWRGPTWKGGGVWGGIRGQR